MSKQSQNTSLSKDEKAKASSKELAKDATRKRAEPDSIAYDLLTSAGDTSLDSHASLLGDTRLPAIQRQAAALEIGKVRGNRHLNDVIAQMRNDSQDVVAGAGQAPAGVIQQENGEMTTRGGADYEVQPGDTLWRIARDTYGHGRYWRNIYRANPDKAYDGGNLILIGTVLTLPEIEVPSTASETPEEAPEPAEAAPVTEETPVPAEPTTTTAEAVPAAETTTSEGTGTGEATHPVTTMTEFGSFLIYPDEFIGPLPLSVRDEESWPIRQSDFDALVERLAEVKAGSSNISVTGTEEFQTHVYLDLGWLMTSGVGQELIREIQEAGHDVAIVETGGGNGASYIPNADSWETEDVPPRPGPGSDVSVSFNPNRLFIKDGSLDWHNRPPAIGLAHEMVHAWTGVYGMRARGRTDEGVKRRELQATGLGEFADNRLTENRFRAAFGLPPRPEY